ncbi:hypothetical protein [Actinoallomurus soli]|uniref:hypothetical protein n=1 Tax=Actinoallomurus soli TaxID=2952535 RepID=UPI0020921805|nr:hypothetical protein [Actinoallomurus soli]MCO5973773.1 hypothetical protein [Actinoallomurus soli]
MPSTFHAPRARVALAAVACLASLLAGCGKGGDPSAAAGGSAAPASSAGSAGTLDQQYSAWQVKFRSCLSDKGFELPKEPGKIDFGDRQDAYKVAEDACLKQIGQPPTARAKQNTSSKQMQDKQMQEKNLRMARCFRDRGYDVKDPKPEEPLVMPENVAVKQQDLDACTKA